MLVFVSGSIRTGPEEHPIKFSQVCTPSAASAFHLLPPEVPSTCRITCST
ncbi:hypothetical protein C2845_PM15G17850 [Panicum miliaceum]|uniref:Uncharacterized protein n=1 Tax=Panicum miliaceum TaxID=4540 RepID=A0A3L6Q7U2_PANMI|nr:hypothetical protein C2845_PM15G17850 [Panicum miliaceum]